MRVAIQFIWLGITCFYGTRGFISSPPENAAVNQGGNTMLNCTTNATIFSWHFQPDSSSNSVPFVGTNCVFIAGQYSCNFSVSSTSSTSNCQVVITNASTECAGHYICSDSTGVTSTRSAMVIVLNSAPVCLSNATNSTQIEESTPVKKDCDVSYTTPHLLPQLNWSHPADSSYTNKSYAHSSYSIMNTIPRIPSDTCVVSFLPPSGIPITNPASTPADNAPNYRSSCSVDDIFPFYCPIHANVTGAKNCSTHIGTMLNCTADANPSALEYEWKLTRVNGTKTRIISTDPTVQVFEAGMYTCSVRNNLTGCPNATAELYICAACDCGYNDSDSVSVGIRNNHGCIFWECAACGVCNCAGCIALEVILILIVIASLILLIIWIYLCFRNPGPGHPATWWCYGDYSKCNCWREACRGQTNPKD